MKRFIGTIAFVATLATSSALALSYGTETSITDTSLLSLANADPVSQAMYGSSGSSVTAETWLRDTTSDSSATVVTFAQVKGNPAHWRGLFSDAPTLSPASPTANDITGSGVQAMATLQNGTYTTGATWNGLTLSGVYAKKYTSTPAEWVYYAVWQNNSGSPITINRVCAGVGSPISSSGSSQALQAAAPFTYAGSCNAGYSQTITLAPGDTYGAPYSGPKGQDGVIYWFWAPNTTVDCGRIITYLLPATTTAPTYNQKVNTTAAPASGSIHTSFIYGATPVDATTGTQIPAYNVSWTVTDSSGNVVFNGGAGTSAGGFTVPSSNGMTVNNGTYLDGSFSMPGTYTVVATSAATGNYPSASSSPITVNVRETASARVTATGVGSTTSSETITALVQDSSNNNSTITGSTYKWTIKNSAGTTVYSNIPSAGASGVNTFNLTASTDGSSISGVFSTASTYTASVTVTLPSGYVASSPSTSSSHITATTTFAIASGTGPTVPGTTQSTRAITLNVTAHPNSNYGSWFSPSTKSQKVVIPSAATH